MLQARVSSSRLPGKVLKPILGKPMLLHQLERLQRAREIDRLVVVTSREDSDTPLVELLEDRGIDYYRGSLDDVLDRYFQAARYYGAEHIVRLTGDCPLVDPDVVNQDIRVHKKEHNDYTSNTLLPTFPDGLDVEVLRYETLQRVWENASLASEREHVSSFVINNPEKFLLGSVTKENDLSQLRWTVDEKVDFDLVTAIYEELYLVNRQFTTSDVLMLLKRRPELLKLNNNIDRNEGLQKSLLNERNFI